MAVIDEMNKPSEAIAALKSAPWRQTRIEQGWT